MSEDGARLAVRISSWPVARRSVPLHEFLRYATKPLSEKALTGFHARLQRSSLNRPHAFDDAIRRALGLPENGGIRRAEVRVMKAATTAFLPD